MPALDGVRGLAILLVLASHFFPTYSRFSQFGSEGVSLFFALSGYLITRVLLQYPEQPLSQSAGDFYFRRGLRLVPALYLAIAFGVLFDLSYMRQDWWIHGLYLTNFRVAINQAWGGAPHFWTLAVEEQFYLVWFFCVMTARGKWILRYIVIGLAIPFLFRATVEWWGQHLLPGQTDLLCAGALLAYGQERDQALFKVVARVLRNPVFLAAVILLTMVLFVPAVTSLVVRDVALSASVWLYAAIVLHAATARSGPLAAALGWAPLRHIGKISYGIYVYHNFVPEILTRTGLYPLWWLADGRLATLINAVVPALIALMIAEMSWRFVESPVLRLKGARPRRHVRWFPRPYTALE